MNDNVVEKTRKRLLAQLTSYLPASVAEELLSYGISITHGKGSTLIVQGSSADTIFWIISGVVKVSCLAPNGNRILLKLAGPSDVLGYPTLLGPEGGVLQPFDVQALTESTVVAMISHGRLIGAIEKLDQATSINLIERLNETWSSVAQRLATFLGCSFRQRLELVFEDLASRFGVEDDRGFLLNLNLSHMDFAEMIGSSRPMATVLIGEMIADGSLYRQGQHQYVVPHAAMKVRSANGGRALLRSGDRKSQNGSPPGQ